MDLEVCEWCHKPATALYGVEKRGIIDRWTCESCWFRDNQKKQQQNQARENLIAKEDEDVMEEN